MTFRWLGRHFESLDSIPEEALKINSTAAAQAELTVLLAKQREASYQRIEEDQSAGHFWTNNFCAFLGEWKVSLPQNVALFAGEKVSYLLSAKVQSLHRT